MKKSTILLACLILLTAATAHGRESTPDQMFEQANRAYSAANYRQAIDQYLEVAASAGVSSSLLYNLANSYAAAGQMGLAVLNYHRALLLAPGNGDIKANLDQVRKDAGLYQDKHPFYLRFAGLLGGDQWLMLAGAAFLLLAVTLLLVNLVPDRYSAPAGRLSGCFLLLVLITLPPALFNYRNWNDAIVTAENVRLLISPFPEAGSSGMIQAGRRVHLEKSHGRYLLVRDATGHTGWLNTSDFERLADLPHSGIPSPVE